VWNMAGSREALQAYAAARLADTATALPPHTDRRVRPGGIDAMAALAETGRVTDMLHRRTAILLSPRGLGGRLRPSHRDIGYFLDAMAARVGFAMAEADPFLLRHLAARLDRPLLAALRAAFGTGGALDAATGPVLHVAMSPATILSEDFVAATAGMPLGIEVALLDAASDPAAFAQVRQVLEPTGMQLVLGGVSSLALQLTDPSVLQADLLKLDWSESLAGPSASPLDRTIERIGPERLVLNNANTEAALRWGLGRGIRRFQGRHVDAMLAASRLVACDSGRDCTLRQCGERAASGNEAVRRGCRNRALLDVAAP
jgi:hypothetical protein